MSPSLELLRAVALALAMLWAAGSILILVMKPWRYFERDDRWLAWALIAGWPFIFGAMAIELALEFHLDRKDSRAGHVR